MVIEMPSYQSYSVKQRSGVASHSCQYAVPRSPFLFKCLLMSVLLNSIRSEKANNKYVIDRRLDRPTYASYNSTKDDASNNMRRQREPPENEKNGKDDVTVVQILETEYYDSQNQNWKAHPTQNRWTTLNGKSAEPPSQLQPPKEYEFTDNWKIVTSAQRDNMGWEYFWNKRNQQGLRRRTWLRTIQQVAIATKKQKAVSTATVRVNDDKRQSPSHGQRRALTSSKNISLLLRNIKDDWNFKGFGFTIYKSLVIKEASGVAFQLPLSTNFGWCVRHPAFPSFASSVALFYPWMVVVFLNASINVEWVKFFFEKALRNAKTTIQIICLTVASITTCPLLVISFYRRALRKNWNTILNKPPIPSPQYSLEIQERVGTSVSWRVSQERGYEYRVSYWHMYLPTMMYLLGIGDRLSKSLWGRTTSKALWWPFSSRKRRKKHAAYSTHVKTTRIDEDSASSSSASSSLSSSQLANWLRQKTGSLGLSTASPMPVPPHFSCNAIMTLSGFFFKPMLQNLRRKSQHEQSSLPPLAAISLEDEESEISRVLQKDKKKQKEATAAISSALEEKEEDRDDNNVNNSGSGADSGGTIRVAS